MDRFRHLKRNISVTLQYLGIMISTVFIIGTVVFICIENSWVEEIDRGERDAFLYGTIGTEIVPLPVLQVLPEIFPEHFMPAGPDAGDWIEQFGFNRHPDDTHEGLPIGMSISNYRPKSGSPSPVPFVGFTCGQCHAGYIRTSDDDPGQFITGMGNYSLDFIAWVDALRTSVLDEKKLTPERIEEEYRKKFGREFDFFEMQMIKLWLNGLRDFMKAAVIKWDEPYGGKDLRDPRFLPNGPARTQPFKNLIKLVLDRPGSTDKGYSKLPVMYDTAHKHWGQFDGSIGNVVSRSVLAAISTGSTIENLLVPEIQKNALAAIEYSKNLKPPVFTEIFPEEKIDLLKANKGKEVYMKSCYSCHGVEDGSGWKRGPRQGELVSPDELGVDAERINFRFKDRLADAVYNMFPDDHPLKPKREDIRPGPAGDSSGYQNTPLKSAFSRVPFLHNGSIATMAELINLVPRKDVYYRGTNLYDTKLVGLNVPTEPDTRRYYRFDSSEKGNSNKGHDYPWAYKGEGWNEKDLVNLLEYLKTI